MPWILFALTCILIDIKATNLNPVSGNSCDQLIYLIVNPLSGGNEAATFIRTGVDYYHFGEPGHVSHVYIADIRHGESGNKPVFTRLANDVSENDCVTVENPVRIIIAGGDGTVVWGMQEALEHNVNLEKVAFGTIPYGTGNDFARVFGWGWTSPGAIFNNDMTIFKSLVREWLNADTSSFDLWDVTFEVTKRGHIKKWKNTMPTILRNINKKPLRTMTKTMSNYFSIGVESRIGMAFDSKRTGSQTINKGIYALEGLKNMFAPPIRLADAVHDCTADSDLFFTTDTSSVDGPLLTGNPASIIFLNIQSFAGGCDIWADSNSDALENGDPREFSQPSPSDGKLEVIAYQSLLSFGLEQLRRTHRFIPSFGQRVGQVDGVVSITFKDGVSIFAQVDGEFYNLKNPRRITLKHKKIARVLIKTPDEDDIEELDDF